MASKTHLCPFVGCGKSFSGNWSLTRHLRKHNNLKPFKCTYCEKEFIEKCALSRHEQTHFEDHPWKCDYPDCGRRFKLKEYRDHHRKQHPRNYAYQPPADPAATEGEDVGHDGKPSSDQLRHRLVKLTIRHKEQLQLVEEKKKTFQEAFNECFKLLEEIDAYAPSDDGLPAGGITMDGEDHTVADTAAPAAHSSPRCEAIKALISKYAPLAAAESGASGLHQAESAPAAEPSSERPSDSGLTAGIVMERLHGTISSMSSSNLVELAKTGGDGSKGSRRQKTSEQSSTDPEAEASDPSTTDGAVVIPSVKGSEGAAVLEADSTLATEIIGMLSNQADTSPTSAAGDQDVGAPMSPPATGKRAGVKRTFSMAQEAAQSGATQLSGHHIVDALNATSGDTSFRNRATAAAVAPVARPVGWAPVQPPPSANIQNVVNWLVAWNSKKGTSGGAPA